MNTEKSRTIYKVIVAISFGLMGFFANYYPLNVLIPPNKASFVWGLVFPMLISLSWGWRYGLLSSTLGLGAQTMWILWLPKNGWAPFVAIPFYTFWIMWHGWCTKNKNKGFLSTIYGAEVPFRILYAIVLSTVFSWSFKFNPSPWAPQMTVTTAPAAFVNFLQFKVIFEGYIVLLLADVLRSFRIVKKILLLDDRPESKSDYIISGAMLFGLVFWIVSGIAEHMYSTDNSTLADKLILNISPQHFSEKLLIVFLCLVAGLLISKYFSKYKESEEKYRSLFNEANDGIVLIDNNSGTILECNKEFEKQTGRNNDELRKMKIWELRPPEKVELARQMFNEISVKVTGASSELELQKPDGSLTYIEFKNQAFQTGDTSYRLSISRDISKRLAYETKIINSLKEKEVLLREVHHRVKNNMAVISSLLRMQSAYVKDPKDVEMFKESQSRIRTMALVHEKLYQSEDFAHIDIRDYIETLAQSIKKTFSNTTEATTKLDVDDIELDIDVLIPCGLIINEILTNAFKHAFNGHESPKINISLKKVDEEKVLLTIADNGVGLPEGFDINQTTGLGLKLVTALCTQLNGTLQYKSDNGAVFTLTFPKEIPVE